MRAVLAISQSITTGKLAQSKCAPDDPSCFIDASNSVGTLSRNLLHSCHLLEAIRLYVLGLKASQTAANGAITYQYTLCLALVGELCLVSNREALCQTNSGKF